MPGIGITVVLTTGRTYAFSGVTAAVLAGMEIQDRYYRDFGDVSKDETITAGVITALPEFNHELVTELDPATGVSVESVNVSNFASYPDDTTHIAPRQLTYERSYWQFTIDGFSSPVCWMFQLVAGFYPTPA